MPFSAVQLTANLGKNGGIAEIHCSTKEIEELTKADINYLLAARFPTQVPIPECPISAVTASRAFENIAGNARFLTGLY